MCWGPRFTSGQTALCCCSHGLIFPFSSLDSHSPEKSRGPEEPKGLVLLFTKFEGAVPLTSIVLMGHGGELHDAR